MFIVNFGSRAASKEEIYYTAVALPKYQDACVSFVVSRVIFTGPTIITGGFPLLQPPRIARGPMGAILGSGQHEYRKRHKLARSWPFGEPAH